MSEHRTEVVEEVVVQREADPLSSALRFAIFFVIAVALTGVLYLVVTNVLDPVAPRTAAEAQLVAVRNAVKANPNSGGVWADYIRALTGVQQYDQAEKELENARRVLNKTDEQRLLAEIAGQELLLAQQKYPEAYKAGTAAIALENKVRETVVKEAAAKGLMIDPKLFGPEITTDVYLFHARAAGALEKWDEAIESLDMAIKYTPRAADLYFLRGDAYLRSGDKKNAAKDFKAALKFDPQYTAAQVGLEKAGESK